jgi:hypothetical protein
MRRKSRRSFCKQLAAINSPTGAALALVVLTGCVQSKHVSDTLTFHAPEGWTEMSQRADPDIELWHSTSQHGILSLDRDLPALDAAIVVKSLVKNNGRLVAQRTTRLCGNQPTVYSRVIQKARTGSGTYTWEVVTSRTPSALWEAQYMHPTNSAPDARAQAALYELCPAK